MKTSAQHPLILATTRRVELSANDQHQKASEPVIRLKLDKPKHWEWQLTTSADDLPLIQLLDRDGRLLVETTGRVAQRARGSFREGLRSHESFPDVPASPSSPVPRVSQGNRNYDGFSSKFDPRRRSSSEISVSSASTSASRLGRKRHSAHAGSLIAECDENVQVQADGLAEDGTKTLTKESLDGIRRFLRDQIQLKMEREKLVTRSSSLPQGHEKFDRSDKTKVALSKEQESFRFKNDATPKSGSDSIERCKATIDKNEIQRAPTKHLSTNGKSKAYRRSKSDRNLKSLWDDTSVDSDCISYPIKNNYPTRRVKSQEFYERSWREYKQRKRHEKSLKNSPSDQMIEEDCESKLKWKDLQEITNRVNNCRVNCENMTGCDGHIREKTKKNYCCSLQENYMSIASTCHDALHEMVKIFPDRDSIDSPDFGYDSIPKRRFKNISDSSANFSAKKADTLKNFRESGCSKTDSDEICYDYSNKTNKDITRDYFKRVNQLLARRKEEIWIRTRCLISGVNEDESFPDYAQQGKSTKKRRLWKKAHKLSKAGEDAVLSFSGRRESRKQHSLHGLGSVSGAHDQEHRQEQRREEGSSLAKRPRHPPPSTPSSGLCVSSTERSSSTSASSSCCTSSKRSRPGCDGASEVVLVDDVALDQDMGANLGKQSSKGLDGRRVQSSGNLYDHHHHCNIGRILANHTKTARQDRYKFCGSLPNHLDGQDCTDDVTIDNNNTVTDTINGNLGGTLPHKKHQNGTVLSNESTNNPDRVKNGSDESLHGDPWKYRLEGADLARCRHAESWRKSRGSLGSCSGSVGSHSCQQHQHHSHSCQHTHSCHHQHQHDSWRRNSSTLCRGRAHRSAELDVNGSAGGSTLPKTSRQDSTKRSAPSLRELGDGPTRASRISIDKIDDELLLKMVRNSKSDLSKHKAQSQQAKDRDNNGAKDKDAKSAKTPSKPSHLGKCIDLKLHKLTTGGEPQDQGYASERSPEEEHAPVLPGQPFPNITPESTFRVTLQKSSRGLGLSVSGGGTSGPVRVKRLFPQQPAALSNRLQPGDILLAANGIPLTGLTNYEALEVLRTTSNTVELVVSRLPGEKDKQPSTPPGQGPPPPPQRRNTHDRTAPLSTDATTSSINTTTTTSTTGSSSNRPQLTLKIPPLKPLAPLDLEPCGEFDIEMTKVSGSLGFTLRKADSSALGHYVRALVREPALSDGRIQPGDKIIAVDDQPLSPMSHEEAVALLRRCGPRVKLRLYRDLAQTPVSALSPTESTDHPLRPPKTCLRQEAVDMLCDLAVRKLSPGTSSGSSGARQSSSNDDGGGGSGSGSGAGTSTAAGGATSNSPRRLRRPAARSSTADADEGSGGSGRTRTSTNRGSRASTLSQEEATSTVIVASSDSDACSIKTQLTAPEAPTSILPSASIGSNSTSHHATQLPSRKPSTIANESHQPQICADYSSDSSSQFHQEPVLRSNGYPPRRSSSLRNGYSEGPLFDSDCSECAAAAALGPDVIIVTDSCSETEEHTQPPQPQARRRHPGVYPPEEQLSSDDCDLDGRHGGGGPSSMPPRMKLLHAYDRDERDGSCCCSDRDRNGVTSNGFSYRNPAYQSANPACGVGGAGSELQPPATGVTGHSSDRDIPGKVMGADDPVGSKGLLKWKGVMFAPSDPDETDGRCVIKEDRSASGSGTLSGLHEQGHEVFMVELTRGWNSRLGFSLQPEGDNTVISVVHPDSVAAKDGRLKQGDILIMVNDESVEHMTTADIIDLLRKIRGSIGITVLRRKKDST